ncbi:MAG: DUF4870 domain-containing protein [Acidobacteria bacterium]|nr:MAG: DUF4870 domain-containing protein [Acidobacteriota bacterium]
MNEPHIAIAPEDRTLAALTHLSGLSGYIVPLGGILVPILIWMTKKDSPIIASIAKQAILLNLVVFLLVCTGVVLFFTVILIPAVVLAWVVLGLAAVALPIIGALRANEGRYYRYPVVGVTPDQVSATHPLT